MEEERTEFKRASDCCGRAMVEDGAPVDVVKVQEARENERRRFSRGSSVWVSN